MRKHSSKKTVHYRENASTILSRLKKLYPQVRCALNYKTPFQLLIATILSAQCTDRQVNIVTKGLFEKYPAAQDLAIAKQEEIESLIRSTGFFRMKARNIRDCSRRIMTDFSGKIPQEMARLIQLSGVARKTANVVLSVAFGKHEGIAVDTHVTRLSQRLGLSKKKTPKDIERDLMALFPNEEWGNISLRLIEHGRQVCIARKPKCGTCSLSDLCPSANN